SPPRSARFGLSGKGRRNQISMPGSRLLRFLQEHNSQRNWKGVRRMKRRQTFLSVESKQLVSFLLWAGMLITALPFTCHASAAASAGLKSAVRFKASDYEPTQGNPNYIGFFDVGDCNIIAGWAADRNRPNTAINVNVYIDNQPSPLMTVLANASRTDSADIGAAVGSSDNGLHAFNITVPAVLKNGTSHSIAVRFESSVTNLTNSPRSILCGGPAGGITLSNPKITAFEIRTV